MFPEISVIGAGAGAGAEQGTSNLPTTKFRSMDGTCFFGSAIRRTGYTIPAAFLTRIDGTDEKRFAVLQDRPFSVNVPSGNDSGFN